MKLSKSAQAEIMEQIDVALAELDTTITTCNAAIAGQSGNISYLLNKRSGILNVRESVYQSIGSPDGFEHPKQQPNVPEVIWDYTGTLADSKDQDGIK